jgi:hypothetical protein
MAHARADRTGSRESAASMAATGIGDLHHSACEICPQLQL